MRLSHATTSTGTSLHEHKKRTSKHTNLEPMYGERRNDSTLHLVDDRPDNKQLRKPKFHASSDGNTGVNNGKFNVTPPLAIRDDGIRSISSPSRTINGHRKMEQRRSKPSIPCELLKREKSKWRPRVKWEPREPPTDPITESTPTDYPASQTRRFRYIYPPSPKTLAKRKRWRLRTSANSKLRAARKRTPKIYRRVFGPRRNDVTIQQYIPKSVVLTPPHRPTSKTRSPGSSRDTKRAAAVPRSRLPSSDQIVEGVDLPRRHRWRQQWRGDPSSAALDRVEELRVQARLEVSRIVNFGRLLRGYGGAYPSRPRRWKRSWWVLTFSPAVAES